MTWVAVKVRMDQREVTSVTRVTEDLAHRAADLEPALEEIGLALLQTVRAQFETAGGFGGSPWQPLKDEYAQWKRAHFPGQPLLVATGHMREALLDHTALVHAGLNRITYAPQSDIAGYHQTGTSRMPARPPVVIPAVTYHEFERIVLRYLTRLGPTPIAGLAAAA